MIIKASTEYDIGFTVCDDTGEAVNVDASPAMSIALFSGTFEEEVVVSATAISEVAGCYFATFTTPASITAGKVVQLLVSASIGGVPVKEFIRVGIFGKTVDELKDFSPYEQTVKVRRTAGGQIA